MIPHQHWQEIKLTHQRKKAKLHTRILYWDFFPYHYDYVSTQCPLPFLLPGAGPFRSYHHYFCLLSWQFAYPKLPIKPMKFSAAQISLMGQWDKSGGPGSWSVGEGGSWGVWGRVLRCNYPILCFFQSRAEGLTTGWMVLCPFFWAGVLAGDRASIVGLRQSAPGTMWTSKFRAYLSRPERNWSVFHVQWGVLALQVRSMHSLILLWVAGTKEENVWVCVGGIRADINL